MSSPSRHLKQLESELLALGEKSMLIEELDGFIAGLLICPDLINPGEWLPIVWNRDGGQEQPTFDNIHHANRVLGLIMEHYNGVARTLMEHPNRYSPMLPVDERNGDIIWEIWIEGFEKAVKLRPDSWQKLLSTDADTATAMHGMLMLVDVAGADQRLPQEERDALIATAPDNIARWIVTLNGWRLANHRPTQGAVSTPWLASASAKKVGRNDSCPCGSGKKYKKCCGFH
jgi:uncharacterized protein